ncbi:MAG: low molecular weight phosphotyrosine protein phosphatase [Clostridia bacterium]|nr:low molecular weight phosphotyrosine protein phosphatase [Clostridia bacterium]
MTKILFVCHGNICRSPMAEFVMKDLVRKAGKAAEYEIASAAMRHDELGNPVYPPARRVLTQHHISCKGKVAQLMTPEDYHYYNYIIAMDNENLRDLDRMTNGDPDGKVSLLMEYAGKPGANVADPWYTGDFEETWYDVLSGCEGLLNDLER